MMEKVGFIGLGNMGNPMSRRVLAAGFPLVVYDVRAEATAPLAALGAEVAASPAEVAKSCGRVITMLPNSSVVERVVLGPAGLVERLSPGSILLDMGSSVPTSTRKIAGALAERSVEMIDAPVTGAPVGAAEGTLTIMVGGKEEVYQECLPLLRSMGKNIFLIGPHGSGHTIKALNNMMFAVNLLGVCEALVLGVKAGIPAEKIVEVVSTGTGRSYALDTKAPRHILAGNYSPGSTDVLWKDLDIATTLGRALGVPLQAANLAQEVLGIARGRGMGLLDNTCIVKLIEEAAGVRVKPE